MKKDRLFIGLGIWIVVFIFGLFKYVSLTYPSLEGVIKSIPSYIYFILSSGFVFGLVLLVDAFTETKRWGQTPRNLFILSMVFNCLALYLVPLIFNESGFVTLGIIFFILMPASLLFLLIALVGYYKNKNLI